MHFSVVLYECMVVPNRFHSKEYPDYKYQPRKRHTSDEQPSSDVLRRLPSKLARRSGKKLRSKVNSGGGFTKSMRLPVSVRSSSPTSLGGSEMSSAESDLSACTDLEDIDQLDEELVWSSSSESDAFDYLFKSISSTMPTTDLKPVPISSVKEMRRPSSGVENTSYDWLEDYTTPEVAAILANDDWLLEANNFWLHDVVST